MPDEALASEIAKAFAKFESIENLKICLLRAEVANRELPEALEALGAIVDDVACYQTVPETEDATGAAASLLAAGRGLGGVHERLDRGTFSRAVRSARLAAEVPATQDRHHRPRDLQSAGRAGLEANRRSQTTHH